MPSIAAAQAVPRPRAARRWRPGLRTAVLGSSAALVVTMAVALSLSTADHLRQTARASAESNADAIVRGYVDPILTPGSLAFDAGTEPEVEAQLARLVAGGTMQRINIWTRDGRVLYSTDPALQGRRLDITDAIARAFGGETFGLYGTGRTLEIFAPVRGMADANPIGVFEVTVDAASIEERVDATGRDVFLITLAAGSSLLAMLWLAFSRASRRLSAQNRSLVDLNEQLNTMAVDLRQSEARFRSLVQNSSDVVAVLDRDARIVYESDALRRVLGHDPQRRIGEPFADGIHPDDRSRFEGLFSGLRDARAEQAAEFRLRHADASWRWVEAIGVNQLADPAVRGIVLNFRDVTERRTLQEQLEHQAFHDPLTGLANRALFADRVTHALARSSRGGDELLAVLFLDLDDFKVVNDSLGHAAGDELLTAVAERIRACLRLQDTPARLGGDEFAILVEETDAASAGRVAERILSALRQPFALDQRQVFAEASIGIALGSGTGIDGREALSAEELLRNADAAMYTAKSRGKGRFEFYESRMHATALQRLELRGQLEASLAAGDFRLAYQPVVRLVTGEIAGFEALVRWHQADGHLALPAEFIPLAEETGLIGPLGAWVLEEACAQAMRWRGPGGASLSMAVNVSSRQLQDPAFASVVGETLARSRMAPEDLVLELTESSLLDDGDATTSTIAGLKELGVRIALDDFGTGYSSLSHLRRVPIDVLKIDRSFVAGIDGEDAGERALVRSIVRLAHSLDLEIVAEGVERQTQLQPLRGLGVQAGQGFLFSRPLDAGGAGRLLEAGERLVS